MSNLISRLQKAAVVLPLLDDQMIANSREGLRAHDVTWPRGGRAGAGGVRINFVNDLSGSIRDVIRVDKHLLQVNG